MQPTAPNRPPYFLGLLLVGLVGIVGFAVLRSHGLTARDSDDDSVGVRAWRKPVPPKGPWKLLKTTPSSQSGVDIEGVGHVQVARPMWGGGITVWVKLPEHAVPSAVTATAQFGSLPSVPIFVVPTTNKRVVGVFISQFYPSGYSECALHLQQGSIDLSTQTIRGLPPTKKSTLSDSLPQGPVVCGPATISSRVWRSDDASPSGSVRVEFSVSMPDRPGELWDITKLSSIPPAYLPAESGREDFANYAEWPFKIDRGRFEYSVSSAVPYPALQGVVTEAGALRRYEIADEFVEFHNVPLVQGTTANGKNSDTLYANPKTAVTSVLPSGVKVTLYPTPEQSRGNVGGSMPLLVVTYSADPIETVPVALPKSPVLKGRKLPVSIRLFDENGSVRTRLGLVGYLVPEAFRRRVERDARMRLILDNPNKKEMVLPTLRLLVRHRADVETFPYRFLTPILSSAPPDIKPYAMPTPEQ